MTSAEKKAKKERRAKYQYIFPDGKQVRIRRPETVDEIPVYEFLARNADPVWFHQNEMWDEIQPESGDPDSILVDEDMESGGELPF